MDCLNNVQKPKLDKAFDKKLMEQSLNSIMTQKETQSFIVNRGGNKVTNPKDFWEGFTNPTSSPSPSKTPVSKTKVKFYNGDQILAGDYFDGWNDTYFFNTSTFRQNLSFWENPFKTTEAK